ncbi:phosphoribosyl-AMP cyclohydrolase [Candidatus Poriferisodalis sp.]|uniref:phosphoribosyl-AMP cyclohydrolase n=1 Tax=Candidatus Poriferisodalis sp. TaxID=3101277 RepID=UPI003B0212DB
MAETHDHRSSTEPSPDASNDSDLEEGPVGDDLEEGTVTSIDFGKVSQIGRDGHQVVPVVLQDADTGDVLFIGYANDEALRLTFERRSAVLYSTSRNEIWHKGATSGDTLSLVEVRVNCEQNSLLYRVRRDGGGACHTRDADGSSRPGCYYRAVEDLQQLRHIDA